MNINLPPNGALVRLTVKPVGSWASEGDTYRVTYQTTRRKDRKTGKTAKVLTPQTTVRLWDETRQCGTYDSAFMWNVHGRAAQWELVA